MKELILLTCHYFNVRIEFRESIDGSTSPPANEHLPISVLLITAHLLKLLEVFTRFSNLQSYFHKSLSPQKRTAAKTN